jgi:hypothetical protein
MKPATKIFIKERKAMEMVFALGFLFDKKRHFSNKEWRAIDREVIIH